MPSSPFGLLRNPAQPSVATASGKTSDSDDWGLNVLVVTALRRSILGAKRLVLIKTVKRRDLHSFCLPEETHMNLQNDKRPMLLVGKPLWSEENKLIKLSRLIRTLRKSAVIGFSAIALSMLAVSAQAGNLVVNGEFSLFTTGGTNQLVGCFNCAVLQNWTNTRPFTAVYGPNASELIGASGASSNVFLWGPKNGAPNGFNDMSPNQVSDPTANFLASDSDPSFSGTLSQTIPGLVLGQQYVLSYYWSAAQFTDRKSVV